MTFVTIVEIHKLIFDVCTCLNAAVVHYVLHTHTFVATTLMARLPKYW